MKTSCTIIVYHFESVPFLRACIRKIRQYSHPEIEQKIIITEQSSESTYNGVMTEFGSDSDITVIQMKSLWSGYALDYIFRYQKIETDYVCSIEPDVFPIHPNWLYVCIKLLQEYNFTFVGGLMTETNPKTDSWCYYYNPINPIPFYWISQYLRVGKTQDYRELAMEGGFTRFHNRVDAERGMKWGNNDWAKWAEEDYQKRGSDDATIAHCWEDNHRAHDKFSFAVNRIMGVPNEESGYGRIVDDLIFHFGFCRTSCGLENEMGKRYSTWKQRINNGCDDALIEEMLAFANKQPPLGYSTRSVWNGILKKSFPPSYKLVKRIEELKKPIMKQPFKN